MKINYDEPDYGDPDYGDLGDTINDLEIEIIRALKFEANEKNRDEETIDRLEGARNRVAEALALVRSIGS